MTRSDQLTNALLAMIVVLLAYAVVNLRRRGRHRRIDAHRQDGYPPFVFQLADVVDEFLRPPDG